MCGKWESWEGVGKAWRIFLKENLQIQKIYRRKINMSLSACLPTHFLSRYTSTGIEKLVLGVTSYFLIVVGELEYILNIPVPNFSLSKIRKP